MYSQLKQSFQWNSLNENNKVFNRIQSLIKGGRQVTFNDMPTALSTMRNRVKSPIFNKMVDAIKNDRLVLIFNENPSDKVPGFLPFVVMNQGNGNYVAVVFMGLCEARVGEGNEILVNERKLKVAMESAYMTLCMLDNGDSVKLQTANIVKPSSKIYTYMITECINRKHSIKMDQNVFNTIAYMVSRFFIRTTLGVTSSEEIVDNYCMGNCQNPDPIFIHHIVDDIGDESYENIATLIKKMTSIQQLAPRIGKLTVSNFTESYINMYDIAMLLALENFPYFVFNVLSVNETTYVNNYFHLKNIVGDDGKKLYTMLLSSIC